MLITRHILRLGIGMLLTLGLFVLGTNMWVVQSTKQYIFTEEEVPLNDVALVLGTSKRTADGNPNRFFMERMETAADLHANHKIKHILVSGDNRTS